MEIEVGEYVRTIDGFIGIFDRYSKRPDTSIYKSPFNCFIKLQNRKTPLQCHRDYIVKHSKNIIDLIEVNDLVKTKEEKTIIHIYDNDTLEAVKEDIKEGHFTIESIVTHEQMANIEYKVEENK